MLDAKVNAPIVIREIYSPDDPMFLPLMELYVESFPRDEREPLSSFVRRTGPLAINRMGTNTRSHLLAASRGETVVGMRQCHYDPASGLGFFVYIAIHPEFRGQGLGERLLAYSKALLELNAMGTATRLRAILFECERVCDGADDQERLVREKRLDYFLGRGGRIVSGTYIQPPNSPDREPVPLNLLAYGDFPEEERADLVKGFYDVYFDEPESSVYVARALEGVRDSAPR